MQAVCGLNINRKYKVIFLLPCIFSLDKDFFSPWDLKMMPYFITIPSGKPQAWCGIHTLAELKPSIRGND